MSGLIVGRLAAQLGFDDGEFRSGMTRAGQSMREFDAQAKKSDQAIKAAMRGAVSEVDRYTAANAKAKAAQTLAAREVERVEARLRKARESGNTAKIESAEARLEAARARVDQTTLDAKEAEAGLAEARNQASQAADGAAESTERVGAASEGTRGKLAEMVAGGVAVGATFTAITTIGMDYTRTLNTLQAVSGATATQMGQVSAKARELGNDVSLPGTSAVDAAAAMTELAKGGFSVEQSMDGAKGSLQLAAAAQIDAATAAGIQSAALQAFGKDASYAGQAADILSNTSNASSAEITDVALALQQAGTVANGFGVNMADTATMIGLFANAGITGSDAGTLLKTGLQSLTDQSESAQGAIDALGLTVYDESGTFVGLRSLWEQLAVASKSMSDEQFQANTNILFGSDAMRAAMIAAGGGTDAYDKMAAAIGKQGTAAELANAKMQGLPGAWERVQNSIESLALSAYGVGEGALTAMANSGADLIGVAEGLMGPMSVLATPVIALVQGFGALPGPLQTTIALMGAAKVASMLFGNQIQSVRGRMSSAASGIGGFASAVRTSNTYMAQANPQMSALSRTMQVMSAQGGALGRVGTSFVTAATGAQRFGSLAGSAAAGMSVLRTGASGLMGALGGPWGLAITGAIGALSLWMSKKREDAQASQEATARTNSYADALKDSGGAITTNIRDMIAKDDAYESARDGAEKLKISQKQLSDAMVNEGGSASKLTAELDKVIAAHTTYRTEAGQAGGDKYRTKVYDDQAKAAIAARDAIASSNKTLDDAKTKAQRTAEATGDMSVSFDGTQKAVGPMAKSMTEFAESTDGAQDKVGKLAKALDDLNSGALTEEEAVQGWSDNMRSFTEALKENGAAAIMANGHLDVTTEKGSKLQDTVVSQAEAFNELAVATLNSAQVQGQTMPQALDTVARKLGDQRKQFIDTAVAAGVLPEKARAMADAYGLIPEKVVTQLNVQGLADAMTKLNELGIKTKNLAPGQLRILDNTPEVKAKLDELKIKYTTLPDGRIAITDTTPENIKRLSDLGLVTKDLPKGFVQITDTSEQNMARLRQLGVQTTTLPNGMVVVNADDRNFQAVIGRVTAPQSKTVTINTVEDQKAVFWRTVAQFRSMNQQSGAAFADSSANGSIRTYADGGIDGSLPDQALIQPGRGRGLVQWAEGETGTESFVPWAPSKRPRATQILGVTAREFGYGLVPLAAMQKFADGGVRAGGFDGAAAVSSAKSHNGEPYVYGQLDCSGYLSEVWRKGTGQSGRFTTDSDFAALGWVRGDDPSGFTIGTNGGSGENGHMSGRLFGTPIESASDGIKYGGSAQDPTNFPQLWHWPTATQAAGARSTVAGQPAVRSVPLMQNPDGTWTSPDPAWAALIKRESGGNASVVQGIQDANSGGNEASGLFQIAKGTWAANGGSEFAATAGEADPEQQALVAARIFDKSGGNPWGAGMPGREDEAALRAGITSNAVPDSAGASGSGQPVFVTNWPSGSSSYTAEAASSSPSTSSAGSGSASGSTSRSGSSAGSLAKAQNGVATATSAVETAKRRQEDAAGRLRVAETKLSEVRAKGNATASQIQGAEERVAKAKRDSGAAAEKVAAAERKLADARGKLGAAGKVAPDNAVGTGLLPLAAWATGGIDPHAPSKATMLNREKMWITRAGEAGVDEAYIPIDGRPRSKAIWLESGRRMGMLEEFGAGGFGGYTVDTRDSMAPQNLYDVLAMGVGGAMTASSVIAPYLAMAQSGQVNLGEIMPTVDTGNNNLPGGDMLRSLADSISKQLEELIKATRENKQVHEAAPSTSPAQLLFQRGGL